MFNQLRKTSSYRRLAMVGLGMIATIISSEDVSAQTASFDYKISPSEYVMASPDSDAVQHYEMWDSPLGRIIKNSRPFIEVRNTSAQGSGIQLNEFRITIGDEDYNFSDEIFGSFAIVGATTPDAVISSITEDGGNELLITFGDGGLAPDEFVRFQIDLDSDDGTGLTNNPDYRSVFFDMFDDDNTDNSQLTGYFTDTNNNDQPLEATGYQPDLNLPISDLGTSIFTNGHVRPYSAMEMIQCEGFVPTPVIPEPATIVLVLMGAAGAGASVMRRRLG